jgi:hypothetical protein
MLAQSMNAMDRYIMTGVLTRCGNRPWQIMPISFPTMVILQGFYYCPEIGKQRAGKGRSDNMRCSVIPRRLSQPGDNRANFLLTCDGSGSKRKGRTGLTRISGMGAVPPPVMPYY